VRAVQQRLRTSWAEFVKGATNAGVFAADLLQEQQRVVGASMNGCGPPRLLGARPLRFTTFCDRLHCRIEIASLRSQ
jgi:hypothetical protein